MKFSCTISLSEFKAGMRLHIRQEFWRRVCNSLYIVFPVAAVALVFATAYAAVSGHPDWVDLFAPLDVILIFFAILLLFLRAYRIRKAFKQMFPPGREDRTSFFDVDDERIGTNVPGIGEGKYPWTGIFMVAQDGQVILLYITEGRFLLIPRRVLDDAQQSELNELIARHVVKR